MTDHADTHRPAAVLDTCTLIPGGQRDFLLQLAAEGGFRPVWSTGTLDELDDVLPRIWARQGKADDPQRRQHLITEMKRAFPRSTVVAARDQSYPYGLADPDDGHVAHAAVTAGASFLVTDDRQAGFKTCGPLNAIGVKVVAAPDFVAQILHLDPRLGVRAVEQMSKRRSQPAQTAKQIVDDLVARYHMAEVGAVLWPLL